MKNKKGEVVIYQGKNGSMELHGDFSKETIWATQAEIVKLFNKDQSVISRHVKQIFQEKEVDLKSNMQKMHIANSDKLVTFYSLDVILAVGYRTNSGKAIEFRKWATSVLRHHIIDGYTINKKRIGENYDRFLKAVDEVRALLPAGMKADTGSILELVKVFADTWVSLDAYDREDYARSKVTRRKVAMTASDLADGIAALKTELMKKGEASEMFATEKNRGALEGIVGNVMQSFGGRPVYPSLEEKAAHLLYFMIKNHPFNDGNKRSGAFAFVWFLRLARALNTRRLTPEALTAITLLIAESAPRDKGKMTSLVAMLLGKMV